MYFETPKGYVYRRSELGAAQRWCLEATRATLDADRNVVVSNVFTQITHMRDFFQLTDSVTVIECSGSFGSTHDVPAETLARMQAGWEPFYGAIRI